MKRVTFLLLLFITINSVNSQNFSDLKDIKFDNEESYEVYVDQVIDCCYYLLQTPFDKKDEDRQLASVFIQRWIKGKSNNLFKVDDNVKTLTENRQELINLYITCYTKEYLEIGDIEITDPILKVRAYNSLINYCSKSMNKIKLTKEMKELMELKESGVVASIDQYFSLEESLN